MLAARIVGLSKTFGDFEALSDLSLDVAKGEFVTLLGPSGSGKTTLLNLISGFLEPTSGSIEINGEDVTRVPPEARDTALCFQSYALFPHLNVRQNLEFGLRQKKVPHSEREARVNDVSGMLDLESQLSKLPTQLSGGQQQRVSLGRALIMRPGLILFDEPLSNLDAKLRDQVRVEIRRIQREYNLTAIYVTHDQAEALAMSDRILVLNEGRLEQVDTPERLYFRPKTSFVADFIGNANIFEGRVLEQGASKSLEIETAIGKLFCASSDRPPKKKVYVSWRPERARFGEEGLSGRVINRAFQGHFTDLLIETNEVIYRIRTGRTDTQEGDTVKFRVLPEDVILLKETR